MVIAKSCGDIESEKDRQSDGGGEMWDVIIVFLIILQTKRYFL